MFSLSYRFDIVDVSRMVAEGSGFVVVIVVVLLSIMIFV